MVGSISSSNHASTTIIYIKILHTGNIVKTAFFSKSNKILGFCAYEGIYGAVSIFVIFVDSRPQCERLKLVRRLPAYKGKSTSVPSTLNLHPGAKHPVCFAGITLQLRRFAIFLKKVKKASCFCRIIKNMFRRVLKKTLERREQS
jgi:hypothetical protein